MAKRYVIEQYELHSRKVVVEAESESSAVAKLLLGKVVVDTEAGTEAIEVCDAYGIGMDEDEQLCMEVESLGVRLDRDGFIPSIRSVTEE